MNGQRIFRRAAGLAAALLLSLPAAAEEAGPFEVTLVYGAGFGSRVQTHPTEEIRIANSGLAGVRLGYAVGPSFRLEAGWTHASTDLLSRDPSVEASYEKIGDVKTDAYELNAFYDFGRKAARGYLGLGAGGMRIAPAIGTLSESETRFALNAAAGVRFFLTPHLGLRLDGRWRWRDGKTRIGTLPCNEEECLIFTTNWYSSSELTAGVTYRF
ncbi:MAG: outer membrane beta-barrel protein [Holophagales bacterium]|nr:outer membrane beta-barrel protein [Holophagales bacterium]MBK9965689.1 outer membrane beta-barrel protein [Holophagales bacterium]